MSIFKITFFIFKFLGIFPMSFSIIFRKSVHSQKFLTFHYSYFSALYNALLLILIIILLAYFNYVYNQEIIFIQHARYTIMAFRSFAIHLSFFVVSVTYLVFILKQKVAIEIANKLFVIYSKSNKLFNFKLRLREQKLLIVSNAFLFFCMVITDILAAVSPLFEGICVYTSSLIVECIVTEYVSIVMFFGDLLKKINEQIPELQRIPDPLKTEHFVFIREFYLEIYELIAEVNQFFALPMLGCLCKFFCFLVMSSYYVVRPASFGRNIVSSTGDVAALSWLSTNALFLLVTTFFVTKVTNEVSLF